MSAGEGTPQDFAAMFGAVPHQSEPDQRVEQRRSIAERHGLPPEFGERLKGETTEELEADARTLAGLVKPTEPAEPQTLKERAQRNLREQTGFGSNRAKDQWKREFVSLLHPPTPKSDEGGEQ